MVHSEDVLANMEDVKDLKTRTTPGDLSTLSAVAERLARSCNNQSIALDKKNSKTGTRESKDVTEQSKVPKVISQCVALEDIPQCAKEDLFRRSCSPSTSAKQGKPDLKADAARAKSCIPLSLQFLVPPKCRAGQPVRLQGPHGVLTYPLPQGYQPGDICTYVLGPKSCMEPLVVPEGKWPGDTITFEGADGKQATAKVPQGLQPGDVFEIMPPVIMVRVPDDVQPGAEVTFPVPAEANVQDTSDRRANVPKGFSSGMYFPVYV
jgi:hypothetical protein